MRILLLPTLFTVLAVVLAWTPGRNKPHDAENATESVNLTNFLQKKFKTKKTPELTERPTTNTDWQTPESTSAVSDGKDGNPSELGKIKPAPKKERDLYLSSPGNDISLTPDEAKSFLTPGSRRRRSLYEECYQEGCSFEEIGEVYSNYESALEYYYNYKCDRESKFCKERCPYLQCIWGSWGAWKTTKVDSDLCGHQTRSKNKELKIAAVNKRGCNSVPKFKSCPYMTGTTQSRTLCLCKKAKCEPWTWSSWDGDIPRGGCSTQNRHILFKITLSLDVQVGSCQEPSCGIRRTQSRRQCSCKRSVCSPKSWSGWSGVVAVGKCGMQSRSRSHDNTIVYDLKSICGNFVHRACPAPFSEIRQLCNCKYSQCQLGAWSQWSSSHIDNSSCRDQTRTRSYTENVAIAERVDNCNGLQTVCSGDQQEKRPMCNQGQ